MSPRLRAWPKGGNMSEKEKCRDEKVSTEETIQLEIMELDDLDLAAVTGGSEDVAEAALAIAVPNRARVCNTNCPCR